MEQIIQQRPNGMRRVILKLSQSSDVEQHHKDRSDINAIMRRFHKSGILPVTEAPGNYGDFRGFEDFHDAQNRIIQANEDFLALPAEVRDQFDHDPGKLLDFVNDPKNRSECVQMGLLPKEALDSHVQEKTSQKAAQRPQKQSKASTEQASVEGEDPPPSG